MTLSKLLARFSTGWCLLALFAGETLAQNIAVTTRHAPAINGNARVEGSVQQLLGEDVNFNGGAVLTEDLLAPGTPTVTTDGNVTWQGVQAGTGSTSPSGYTVRFNGGVALRYVRTRTNATTIPSVPAPPAPTGTRSVTINQAGQSAGNFATLRDLTLNGNVGQIAVPAGTYRNFTANGGSGFTLGVAGASQPVVYSFQNLTLNGQTTINVLGPVILQLANGLNANGQAGVAAHPEWLQIKISNGGVTLNGGSMIRGSILAPNGQLVVNGQSTLAGTAMCDRFTLNGGGLVKWANTSAGSGNQPPIATAQNVSTAEDVAKAIVLAATDADGNALTFAVASQPAHGTLSGTAPHLTYTPFPNYFGPDSFTFTANDGTANSLPATVSITVATVNDAPVAQAQAVSATEDAPAPLTLMGTDVDGNALTYSITTGPTHGTLSGTAPDLTYTSASNYTGPDSFVFKVRDGQLDSALATVTIHVAPVEDVPVVGPLHVPTPEDQWVNIALTGLDADGDPLIFHVATAPQHGVLTGTLPDLVYTPAANFHGADSFTYYASDPYANSIPATVTITVTPVNDPPVAAALVAVTDEDTAAAFTLPASDVDGDPLTYEITAAPAHGTLSGAAPNLLYTPAANFVGTDSLTFIARDALAASVPTVVSFTVQAVNDAPVANPQAVALNEDTPATVLLTATEADGDPLTFTVLTQPEHGTLAVTANPAAFLYTPAAHYHGPDSFTFQANDGTVDSAPATVTLAIAPVRDVPVAAELTFITPEDQPAAVTLTGTDYDGLDLIFTIVQPPAHGTLTGSGTELTYTPAQDYHGPDSFHYIATDSFGDSEPATVAITVMPVNDAPVAAAQTVNVAEDTGAEITLGATDVENDALTFRVLTQPAHGTLTPSANGATVHYSPAPNYHGPDGFAFVANDGQLDSAPATIAITVAPANDRPVAQPAALIAREDTPLAITLEAGDVEGDALAFTVGAPSHGTLTPGGMAGAYLYTPAPDFNGPDSFAFTASDGQLVSSAATVTIEVTAVNDPPVVQATTAAQIVAPAAIALQAAVTDDSDLPSTGLFIQWSKVSGPGEMAFLNPSSANTTASYTAAGTYVLRVTVSDGDLSATDDVQVVVTKPNQPPVVNAGAPQSTPLANPVNLAGTVQDDGLPQGASLTQLWSKLSGPGAVTFANSSALATTASFGAPGDYVLRLRASDSVLSGQAEVTIKVLAPNQPPQVSAGPAQSTVLGTAATLTGSATDDGLPRGAGLQTQWSKVSGPGSVTFADPFATGTAVQFTVPGLYTLRLTASDSVLTGSADAQVSVTAPENRAPSVNAGPDQDVTFATVGLNGVVSDDGLPAPGTIGLTWTKVSGPGTVTFGNAGAAQTNATFSEAGSYVLRLTATDGELSGSDQVTISTTRENQPPTVKAGPDQFVDWTYGAFVQGTVTDDGLPSGTVTTQWMKVSGPGTVTFANAAAPQTRADFSQAGEYILRLTASDTAETAFDEVKVTAIETCNGTGLVAYWKAENSGVDELRNYSETFHGAATYVEGEAGRAFQTGGNVLQVDHHTGGAPTGAFTIEFWANPNGNPSTGQTMVVMQNGTSTGLNMWRDGGNCYVVLDNGSGGSVFFYATAIPAGVWTHVAVVFDPVAQQVRLHYNGVVKATGAFPYQPIPPNRMFFGGTFPGSVNTFQGALDEIALYNKALTAAELTEIFESDGAEKCGDGTTPANQRPVVDAGPARTIPSDLPLRLAGTYADDGLPEDGTVQMWWRKMSGPGAVVFSDLTDPNAQANFSAAGDYVLRFSVSDGARSGFDEVTIRVVAAASYTPTVFPLTDYAMGGWAYKIYPSGGWPANVGSPTFDATGFLVGEAGFGSGGGCPFQVRKKTTWPAFTDIVIRRTFEVPAGRTSVRIQGTIDNDAIVWVNGINVSGYVTSGGCQPEAINVVVNNLQPGPNLLVVMGHDYGAETYLDARVVIDDLGIADAGLDADVPAGAEVQLDGSQSEGVTGQPLHHTWWQSGGPLVPLNLSDPARPKFFAPSVTTPTTLRFQLRVEESGVYSYPDEVVITVQPGGTGGQNLAPIVSAGSDSTANLTGATLNGSVTDDGLPSGSLLAVRWTAVSGPGSVIFTAPDQAGTGVVFDQPGTYVLRLTAHDSQLVASDERIVTAVLEPNQAPIVQAGPDRSVSAGDVLSLTGSVSDDGRPTGVALTVRWSQVSGPSSVVFSQPNVLNTEALFLAPGTYRLWLTASDTRSTGSDEVLVTVTAGGNRPPTVALGPDRTVNFGHSLNVTANAGDDGLPNGGVMLTWSVLSGPGSVQMTGTDETLTATFGRIGTYVLRATVHDGQYTASDELTVTVAPGASTAPAVTWIAPGGGSSFESGTALTLQASANDPDAGGGIVSVAFYDGATLIGTDSAPDAAGAARLSWTGTALGSHTLTAVATDVSGTTATSASVAILITPSRPLVALSYPAAYSAFAPDDAVQVQATASPGGEGSAITQVEFLVNGSVVGIDPSAPYSVAWIAPGASGEYTLTARATDAAGQTATSAPVLVRVVTDPSAPLVAELDPALDGATITAPTPLLGTVEGPTLASWKVEYRREGSECAEWVTLAAGAQSIAAGGTLGTLDPTLLLNGIYDVRLTARDAFGGSVATAQRVVVEGGMKVGHFTVAFADLAVSLAGLPLTVTRIYDSRERCPGDFGHGWKLDVDSIRLEKSHAMGDAWSMGVTVGDLSTPSTYQLIDDGPHLLTVRMPDGEVLRFAPKLVMHRAYSRLASLLDGDGDDVGQAWLPLQYDQPLRLLYRPRGGTKGATLAARGYRASDPWIGGHSTIAADAPLYVSEPYEGPISLATHENSAQDAPFLTDATGWELTAKDGRKFVFAADGRLESMRDPQGNVLAIVRDGAGRIQRVTHSSGKEITFVRNADGFITEVIGPAGNRCRYSYDAAGDLRAFYDRVTDPGAQPGTQQFSYTAGTHYLTDLFDGQGVRAAKNFYDADGRLTRTVDAQGKETVFTHNVAGRTETIRDRAGNTTTYRYDTRGNVTETTLPDGTRMTTGYHVWSDGRLSELKTNESITGLFTQADGTLAPQTLTTLYRYEDDNPATPPANDGLLRKLIDPLGHATTFSYDARGNVQTVTDALGQTTTNTYYAGTNLLAATTDAAGHSTSFTYDPRGQMDKETRTVTVAGAVQTLVTDYDYDASGYLVKMTDAAGHATTYENDTHGNRLVERTTRTVNGALVNVVTEHEYDANDRLVKTWDAEHPRGGNPSSETVFDENGKPSVVYDALRRETQMTYTARGELETTTHADGASESVSYDADGRREFRTDRRGKVTQTIYDALGRATASVFRGGSGDAPVALSSMTYDAAGRVHTSTDARGNTTTNIYDAAGRRTDVIDALGHASSYAYDAAGRQTSFTDALGRTTSFAYDLLNRRTGTAFADGTTTATGYDELGRRVSETDQNALTKTFTYDGLGRLIAVTDALGQVTSYGYDELGSQLTQTDANNHTTSYGYDALGRRTSRTLPLGQTETMTYNAVGNLTQRTDFNGTISSYTYDALNRLLTRTSNHASAAASNVAFTYTPSGQRATMTDASGVTTYSYDARDRLVSKATPQGTLTYSYDAAGNVASTASNHAEGASVSYGYDALNRLGAVNDAHLGATSYTYDDVGNLQSYAASNGVVHAYAYSPVNRLTQLRLQNATSPLAQFTYTLAAGGQRLGASETLHTPATLNRTVSYTYDALIRLTQETITGAPSHNGTASYTLDPVGNRLARTSSIAGLTSQSFSYDANDRLTTDTYDANGNTKTGRVSLNASGAETAAQTAADSYDAENRLTARTGPNNVQVVYDGDGHKVRETINGQEFRYLVDDRNPTGYAQVLEELQNGTVIRTYSYGHDLLAQDQRDGGGNWSATFYGYDGHGSVRLLTDELGAITDTYTYDAFGTLLSGTGTTFNRYRYCGEQYDDALGLYYLRARYMNAANGRFWNADSYEGQNSDPASLHKYLYANADGVNGTDPSGYFSLTEINVSQALGSLARTMLYGAAIGTVAGGADAYLGDRDVATGALEGAVVGAFLGPLGRIRVLQPLLVSAGAAIGAAGTFDAFMDGNYKLGLFRGITMVAGTTAVLRGGSWNGLGAGGKIGTAAEIGIAEGSVAGGQVSVYRAVSQSGETIYVGITKNLFARAAAHLRQKGIDIKPIKSLENLSAADARAVEQVLIQHYGLGKNGGTLLNKINSIASKNPIYGKALIRGHELLQTAGFPGF